MSGMSSDSGTVRLDTREGITREQLLRLGGSLALAGLAGPLLGAASDGITAVSAAGLPYRAHTNVKAHLTFWHFWGSQVRHGAIRSIIADFMKVYPGVQVTDTYVPFGDIWTKNIAAVASGSGMPDVIVEDRPQLRTRARNKIDISLAALARSDGITGAPFWPFTWKEAVVDGQPYGLPYETDIRVLYYNKSAFKDAGLDPAKPPRNWDDLWSYADKLDARVNNSGSQLQRISFYPPFFVGLDMWAWNNGGDWQDAHYNPTFDLPANVATLEWMKKWADRYGKTRLDALAATFGPSGPTDGFQSQKVVMVVDIQGYQTFINQFKPPFEVGVAAIPPARGHKPASLSGGFALSMPRGPRSAATAAAAWEFIKYLSLVGQARWAQLTYGMPTVEKVAQTDPILKASPHWTEFVKDMSYGRPAEYNPYYPTMTANLIPVAQEAALSGKRTPKQALFAAQQQALVEINRNRPH
jgi:multiple sugar transport system substrate-binding protein